MTVDTFLELIHSKPTHSAVEARVSPTLLTASSQDLVLTYLHPPPPEKGGLEDFGSRIHWGPGLKARGTGKIQGVIHLAPNFSLRKSTDMYEK